MASTKYLTRKEVAEAYPLQVSTLAYLASNGRGPRYRMIGNSAVYRRDEVEEWIESQVVVPIQTRALRKRGRPRKQPQPVRHLIITDGKKETLRLQPIIDS